MPITINLSLVLSLLGLITGIIAILTFAGTRKKVAIEEGKHLALVDELRKDLNHAYDKIRKLEEESRGNDKILIAMQTDIKHILASIEKLSEAISRRTGDCI